MVCTLQVIQLAGSKQCSSFTSSTRPPLVDSESEPEFRVDSEAEEDEQRTCQRFRVIVVPHWQGHWHSRPGLW